MKESIRKVNWMRRAITGALNYLTVLKRYARFSARDIQVLFCSRKAVLTSLASVANFKMSLWLKF